MWTCTVKPKSDLDLMLFIQPQQKKNINIILILVLFVSIYCVSISIPAIAGIQICPNIVHSRCKGLFLNLLLLININGSNFINIR